MKVSLSMGEGCSFTLLLRLPGTHLLLVDKEHYTLVSANERMNVIS